MFNVEFRTKKKIFIHEINQVTLKTLMFSRISSNGYMPLFWCDGILYSYALINNVALGTKEFIINDILHISFIDFTQMKKYTKELETPDSVSRKIPVIDESEYELHRSIVAAIKKAYHI